MGCPIPRMSPRKHVGLTHVCNRPFKACGPYYPYVILRRILYVPLISHISQYIMYSICLCHRVKNRTCSRAHFRKLGWGGVGIIATVSMATLHDLHLHFMLRYLIFTCNFMIFTCTSCYAAWFSLALSWSSLALHATLLDTYMICSLIHHTSHEIFIP